MPNTDVSATPPIIEGFTDEAAFNAAYEAAQPPQKRVIFQAFAEAKINAQQRTAQMAALAQEGFLVDAQIDAFVGIESTPWTITLMRLRYGVSFVQSWNGTAAGGPGGVLIPVPPDLTPSPAPIKQNEWVGDLWRSRVDYIAKYNFDPGGDVYLPLVNGRPPGPLGSIVVEVNGDGRTYRRISQLVPGDYVTQYLVVPEGTTSTAKASPIPLAL